ncbi:FG-GAP and VCBS repeat-containing protein [Streptomyces bugieae]|uniref:FG-GAP and VCBS repeat-containing protein n=1 Tax=Streptomyces bugieae TaxID=3098223 RepID=A0ABU7NKK3_9ACTN|nr:FG-GAP and VCBS repeat-containing protein [Streptomyces sp. DSM 41528]
MTTGNGTSPARSVRPAGRGRSTLSSAACSVLLAAGLVSLDAGPATAATPGLRGDFNGDGYGDVVAASDGGAGRLTVLHGAAGGLGSQRAVLDQESPGVPGHNEDGDGFGRALAAADLDGDGRAELAVAGRGEGGGGIGGRVTVVYGAAGGPGTGRPTLFVDQDTEGVPGTSEPEDTFGGALAIGDVDGDHVGDLVVGAPGETLGSGTAAVKSAGAVTVLRGSPGGLTTAGAQMYTQDSPGVPGAAEPGDRFGAALLLTDTDHDSRADLAVTADGENGTGMVWRLPGSPAGPTGTGSAYYGAPAAPAVRFGVPLEG